MDTPFDARNPMQYIGTYPPVKHSWREGNKVYFETGEFILLTDQGLAIVENSVWELPVDNPIVMSQEVEGNTFRFKVSMKMPRLVRLTWKHKRAAREEE